jgi:hypothetical protein
LYEGCGFDVGHVSIRAVSSRNVVSADGPNDKSMKLIDELSGYDLQTRCTAGQVGTAAYAELSMDGILPGCMSLVFICNNAKESIALVGTAFLVLDQRQAALRKASQCRCTPQELRTPYSISEPLGQSPRMKPKICRISTFWAHGEPYDLAA